MIGRSARPPSACRLAAWLLAATIPGAALATTADDLCLPAATACIIDRDKTVEPDSMLDFGSRPLTVKRGASLDVGPSTMTIHAAALTLEPGAELLARGLHVSTTGGTIVVRVSGDLRLQATGNTRARLDASAQDAGGTLDVQAGGAIEIAGVLAAQATSGGSGGTVRVSSGGPLTVADGAEVRASGGVQGDGGTVTLGGTGIIVRGPIDVSGSTGGTVEMTTVSGDIAIALAAGLDASAVADGGDGGFVTLTAHGGSVAIDGPIVAPAAGGGIVSGSVTIIGDGSVRLGGIINVAGAAPDTPGGDVIVHAALDLVQTGQVIARSIAVEAAGGSVTFTAGRALTIGPIDLRGGGGDGGGTLEATALASATIVGEVDADAPGGGGFVLVHAPTVVVRGSVHANGTGGAAGGPLTIGACTLTVSDTGRLATTGVGGGTILLQSSGRMELAAGSTLAAGLANQLEYLNAGTPPLQSGSIAPPPTVTVNPALPACPGPAHCGDGHLDPPDEECDTGDVVSCDGCSSTCRLEVCGNGTLDCGEECDDGNTADGDGCDHDCTRTRCGNGIVTAPEACDDGNTAACDGCSPTCTEEGCGNGVLECAEECDEGTANGTPGGDCDAGCHRVASAVCGDGNPDSGEQCDDGNTTACDGCSPDCRIEACGNGTPECTEQCDDSNTEPCDGCSPTCRTERCGNGIVDCHEECDDGNTVEGDGCDTNCTHTRCGNGIVTPPEQCDDGNQSDADTCDTSCRWRVPCPGGSCIPCAADTDCDPNGRCAGQQCAAGICTAVAPPACDDGLITTADRCLLDATGRPICEHACLQDTACDDHDLCNGTERCAAGTCRAGTPPGGFTGAGCSLDVVDGAIQATPDADLRTKVRRKLVTLATAAHGRLTAASSAASAGKLGRERRTLRQAARALAALERFIARGQLRGEVPDVLVNRVLPGITTASDAITALRADLTG